MNWPHMTALSVNITYEEHFHRILLKGAMWYTINNGLVSVTCRYL